MIDRICFSVPVDDVEGFVACNKMELQADGTYSNYSVSELVGYKIKLTGGKAKIKLGSLQKFYFGQAQGRAVNYCRFSVSECLRGWEWLQNELGQSLEGAIIDRYEIGINLQLSECPVNYIGLIENNGVQGEGHREFVRDVNFEKNRQKLTDKRAGIKVYHKIYDKTFEVNTKARAIVIQDNILRIETIRRRQNERAGEFFIDGNLKKELAKFYKMWRGVRFDRKIYIVRDGERKRTQAEQAEIIKMWLDMGAGETLKELRGQKERGSISERVYRYRREQVERLESGRTIVEQELTKREQEFKQVLKCEYILYNK